MDSIIDEEYNMIRIPKKRATIIAIEGGDGVGKTTIAKLLIDELTALGYKALYVKFPQYQSEIGSVIRRYLDGTVDGIDVSDIKSMYSVSLLCTLDRQMFFMRNTDDLQEYDYIICDRLYLSNMMYWGHRISNYVPDNAFENNRNILSYIRTAYETEIVQTGILKNFSILNLYLRHEDDSMRQHLISNRASPMDCHDRDVDLQKNIDNFMNVMFPRILHYNTKFEIGLYFRPFTIMCSKGDTLYTPEEIIDTIMGKLKTGEYHKVWNNNTYLCTI